MIARLAALAFAATLAACSADTDTTTPPADCFGSCCQSTAQPTARQQCATLGAERLEPYQCSGIVRPGPDGREPGDLIGDGSCVSIDNAAGLLLCCRSKL